MRTSSLTLRRAPTAIAAVLALTATPLVAQDAATVPLEGPIVATPTTVTAPDPAPVLVIPDVTSVEQPAAEPVGAAPNPSTVAAEAQARSVPAARTSAPAISAAEPVAEPAPVASETLATTGAEAELPPVVPIDEPTNIQPTPEQATDITAVLGLILVALLGLVLAIFAFAYLRRRRAAIVDAAPARQAAVPRPVASVAEPAPLAEPVPVLDGAPVQALRSNGAAVPLPARLPESYEERSALLQRMIEAKPDRANPFTDRRARMRRARLILQTLGRRFEGARPWIDFSDYPENWPDLARTPQAPAAPLRTRELEPA